MLLNPSTSILVVIDVQDKLMPAIDGADGIISTSEMLVRAAAALEVPVIFTEQNPDGLGGTVEAVKRAADETAITVAKSCFSASRDEGFESELNKLRESGRKQVLLTGVEAHICVLQTALGIKSLISPIEPEVFVVADAIGSRRAQSYETALTRMQGRGVEIVTSEMVLFEWLGTSEHPAFRELRRLIL